MKKSGELFDFDYYKKIVENMYSGVAICQMLFDEEGKAIDYSILWVNQNFEDQTGLKKEEVLGRRAEEIYENDIGEWMSICTDVIDTGDAVQFEIKSNNLDRYFAVQVMHLDREIFAIVYNDITKRENFKLALIESESRAHLLVKELKEDDKNKNIIINTLSHELRNPLAVILAGLETLDISRDLEAIKKIKGIIERQTKQLNCLADDLLAVARITSNKIDLKKEIIDVKSFISSLAKGQGPLFSKKGISLRVQGDDGIFVEADYARLEQVIGNLLDNAYKYTPKGGRVTIKVGKELGDAVIKIQDSGIGLESHFIPQMFQTFVQLDRSYNKEDKGLGLGLAIVKDLVELHGGKIDAYSEGKGKGSEFTVSLPILEIDNIEKKNEDKAKDDVVTPFSMLIIEDNKVLADLLCELVNMAGHLCQLANNGNDGINLATAMVPDIILCDIGLPGMSGLDVAKIIRSDEKFKNTLLVAMTGYGREDDIQRTRESEFDKHLVKPVSFEMLRQLFDEIRTSINP